MGERQNGPFQLSFNASQDPTFRLIGSEKTWDSGAALTSPLQTFETEMLAEEDTFRSLARIDRELIGKAPSRAADAGRGWKG